MGGQHSLAVVHTWSIRHFAERICKYVPGCLEDGQIDSLRKVPLVSTLFTSNKIN